MHPNPSMESSSPFLGLFLYSIFPFTCIFMIYPKHVRYKLVIQTDMFHTNGLIPMNSIPKENKYDWPMDATLDVIGGKWKPLIIYELNDETLRFSRLLDCGYSPEYPRGCLQNSPVQPGRWAYLQKVYTRSREGDVSHRNGKILMPFLYQLCCWDPDMGHIKYLCEE